MEHAEDLNKKILKKMFSGNESRAVFRYIFLEKQEDAIGPIYV
jgi:hypothetical protein